MTPDDWNAAAFVAAEARKAMEEHADENPGAAVSDHLKRVVIERLSGLFDDQHPSAHIDVEVTFRDGRFLHVHLTSKTELGRLVMLHLSRGDDSV